MSTQSLQVTTGVELAGIDDLLTVDERLVRSSVRALCEEHVDPFVADWFERGEIDEIRGLTKALGAVSYTHLDVYKRQCRTWRTHTWSIRSRPAAAGAPDL